MNTFFMSANPSISLIFVNYRSARHLVAALESLFSFEQASDSFEIIAVNNDPAESAAFQALKQIFPLLLIESGENSGFSRGNNLGARQARGRILGFINPDVLWTGVHLQKIAQVFDKDTRIGVLGMTLLDTKRRPEAWSSGKEPSLTTLFLNNFFPARRAARQEREPFFPDWVSGGALFIRKELFAEIGGFDERFFLYFEDVDLCKEVRHRGFSVARHPEFSLIHLGGKSRESRRLQKKYYALSQREYFRKHRPKWEGAVLGFLQFFFRKG
ncbi:MAG: hypothetical protein A3G09_04620 [Candidatus Moranbacteria bacterium RIFCSPLOWO2_12_FULL_48_12]|nr:MAG: hypothetical protein A3G09_04620 [Candidatus Moranbacteria bacterium RIFCSPLOWO2_12_FULL_48_12]